MSAPVPFLWTLDLGFGTWIWYWTWAWQLGQKVPKKKNWELAQELSRHCTNKLSRCCSTDQVSCQEPRPEKVLRKAESSLCQCGNIWCFSWIHSNSVHANQHFADYPQQTRLYCKLRIEWVSWQSLPLRILLCFINTLLCLWDCEVKYSFMFNWLYFNLRTLLFGVCRTISPTGPLHGLLGGRFIIAFFASLASVVTKGLSIGLVLHFLSKKSSSTKILYSVSLFSPQLIMALFCTIGFSKKSFEVILDHSDLILQPTGTISNKCPANCPRDIYNNSKQKILPLYIFNISLFQSHFLPMPKYLFSVAPTTPESNSAQSGHWLILW